MLGLRKEFVQKNKNSRISNWTFAKSGFTSVCTVVFATRNKDLRQFSAPENRFCKSPVSNTITVQPNGSVAEIHGGTGVSPVL